MLPSPSFKIEPLIKDCNSNQLIPFLQGSHEKSQVIAKQIWLVVEPTHLKNMLVKLDHFPK